MKRRTAATAIACLVVIVVIIASYVEHTNLKTRKLFFTNDEEDDGLTGQFKIPASWRSTSRAHCDLPEIIDGKIQFLDFYEDVHPDPEMHNIFLLETSSETEIRQKYLCVVESYCSTNPNSVVWLLLAPRSFSLDLMEDLQALRTVHRNLCVAKLNFTLLFQDTPLLPLYKSKKFWNTKFLPNNLSNLGRLAVVYKSGGYYSDVDVVALRTVDHLRNFVGQASRGGELLNNAVFHFEKKHPFLLNAMKFIAKNYQGNKWGANGPNALTAVVKDMGCDQDLHHIERMPNSTLLQSCRVKITDTKGKDVNLTATDHHAAKKQTLSCDLTILSNSAFYPISWKEAKKSLFVKSKQGQNEQSVLTIFPESCGVHLSNKITKNLKLFNGSTAMKLVKRACPITIPHPTAQ